VAQKPEVDFPKSIADYDIVVETLDGLKPEVLEGM